MTAHLPNLIIPGVTKASTTSVFWYLSQHPEICAADTKQINHYAPLRYGREPDAPLSTYAAHFSHCSGQRYRLDASPTYFYGGQTLVKRLADDLPDPRILVLLRDPSTRLWSSYTYKMSKSRLPSSMTFSAFVDRSLELAEADGVDWEANENYRTLAVGRYADHLPTWFDIFGDRVDVLFFEDVKADPVAALSGVYEWLDLDPSVAQHLDYAMRNKTIQPRSHGLRKAAEVVNRWARPLLERVPALKDQLRGAYYRSNARTDRPTLDPMDAARVSQIYAEDNRRLADLLGDRGTRPLPAWLSAD